MKKSHPVAKVLIILTVFASTSAWAGRQEICHFPPNNPTNFHTLTVGDRAVGAHVTNHNDLVGSCLANCETICDDGNACTIDVEPNMDQCICAAEPRSQVDCDDGNSCTADACDAVNGTCSNDPGPLDGTACTDRDPDTTGETCRNGNCQPCPCFTSTDLLALGAVSQCGIIPGFPNSAGIFFVNGNRACSGERCAGPDLTCGITSPLTVSELTIQQDRNCRGLILDSCPIRSLNLTTHAEESSTLLINQ